MKKLLCVLIAVTMLISFPGCARNNGRTGSAGSYQTNKEQAQRIDQITSKFGSGNSSDYKILDELSKADETKTAELLMDFADDMAKAQFFGFTNDEVLAMAGEVAKNYPHPLILNNYAAMLTERAPEDALYLLLQALDYEPGNPMLLSNIANVYIQLEDYGAAERYAKEALQTAPEFGPAYQVLTTCHLKNGDSILAAETMVKSAKDLFNDVTAYHFDSFLMAVQELNPKEDEYPLKEEFLKELYEIAKENVDTLDVNQNVDTPEAQLTLKDLPQASSPDDLRKYLDYISNEHTQTWDGYNELEMEYVNLKLTYDEEQKKKNESRKGLAYPVERNLRQQYALDVLASYYLFQLDKIKLNAEEQLDKMNEEYVDKCYEVKDKYEKKKAENAAELQKLQDEYDKANAAGDFNKVTSLMQKLLDMGNKMAVEEGQFEVDSEKEQLPIAQSFAPKMKDIEYKYYYDTKQLLEEYWLRSGGILKYITDETLFKLYDNERRQNVDMYISYALNRVGQSAEIIDECVNAIKIAEQNLAYAKSVLGQGMNGEQPSLNYEDEDEDQEQGSGLIPDMEEGVISTYPDNNVVGDIGVEFSLFDALSASAQYDGKDYSLEVSGNSGIFKGTIGGKTNVDEKKKEAYSTIGVDVKIDAGKLIPEKVVGKNVGKLLGSIKFGTNESVSKYNVMSSDNKITDMGYIRQSEIGGEVGPVGVTGQTQVKRSSMTGVAIKSKAIKYKFLFVTYTVPNN